MLPRAGAGSQVDCSCVTKHFEKALKGSPYGLGGFGWERGGWVALAKGGLILAYFLTCPKAYEVVMIVTPCLHFLASVCIVQVHQLASTWCCHFWKAVVVSFPTMACS